MINFSKSFFYKANTKESSIDSDELSLGRVGGSGNVAYAEKLAVKGLSFPQMKMMYISNTWVRAIVDKTIERITEVAPLVKPLRLRSDQSEAKLSDETKKNMDLVSELLEKPNSNYETLTEIRKKIARDILVYDAGSMEIVRGADLNKGKKLVEIYAVPGNTVKINADEKGLLKEDEAYIQVDRHMKKITSWKKNQLLYYKLNPQSDRLYGLSPLESLIQTVTAELYSSQFNLDFFYNNATPRFAVLMEGLGTGQGQTALTRFRTWWDTELRGQPHRPIVIGTENGKISFQKVGMSNEEMQFQEYSKMLLQKIMAVYKMQPVVLGVEIGSAAKGSVTEQVKQFKIDAVKPHMVSFTDKYNKHIIFDKTALGMTDVYLDFDLDIIDKKDQAEWHQMYLDKGVITINEIRTTALGLMPVPWGDVPYLQNNVAPFGIGPNGQSVPGDPNAVDKTPQAGNVPNVNLISRSLLTKYLSEDNQTPVGWETMEPSQRLAIVEQIINDREQFLSKTYTFPADKVTKINE